MPDLQGALGFSLHTGWAAVVAIIRGGDGIEAVFRRRMDLMPVPNSDSRFVYHRAAEVSLEEAAVLVQEARAVIREAARRAIREMLASAKLEIRAAGVPAAMKTQPKDLSKILASHALIHAAEGQLFRDAVLEGCRSNGVAAVCMGTRELWPKAAEVSGIEEVRLRGIVDAMGKTIGPPWTADQKIATAAGLVALMRLNPTS
jgi:hypothetical protein